MPHEVTTPKGNGAPDLDRLLSARRVRELPDASGDEVRPYIGDRADPVSLTPHARLRELTAVLANGIHRLRIIPPALPDGVEFSTESSPTGLEAVAATRPYASERQPERTLET